MQDFNREEFLRRDVCTNFYDSTHSEVGPVIHQDRELQNRIKKAIQGKKVIELGCCDLSRYCLDLFIMGADSYIGVDPFYLPNAEKVRKRLVDVGFKQAKDKSIEYVPRDALSYLEMLPEGNEIVIFSSGTLESSIIHDKQYAKELVRQIARLTNLNNPSTIHVVDEFFAKLFREEGLLLDFGRTIPCNDFIIGLYKRAQPQ